jgi:hypothetical protein
MGVVLALLWLLAAAGGSTAQQFVPISAAGLATLRQPQRAAAAVRPPRATDVRVAGLHLRPGG